MQTLFPEHIRGARGILQWSQVKLAAAFDVDKTTIARLERSTRHVTLATALKIEKVLADQGVMLVFGDAPGMRFNRPAAPDARR